jgi:hypothetical protein
MANANDQIVPWKLSTAKEILKDEILMGNVTKETSWLDVYNSNPQYQQYETKNFRVNLKNLLISLDKKEERAIWERDAVLHDRILHPRSQLTNRGYPFWDTSAASGFLRDDVKDELHKTMSVDQLWRSRVAYQQFPRNVFGQHILQESNRVLKKSYWLNKRKKN